MYSTFTQFLGFQPNRDEWKVMALSALGNPKQYYKDVKQLVHIKGLSFELDLSFFEYYLPFTPRYYSPKFVKTFGIPTTKPGQNHYNLVAALQRVIEETVFTLLNNQYRGNPTDYLVLGGGCFMNSVLNGKILSNTPYKDVFIGGSPDDSGVSIGSALEGAHTHTYMRPAAMSTENFYGIEYTDYNIREILQLYKIPYSCITCPEETAATLLADGHIVGWFQGRSEFGQRALGHRSILASPIDPRVKDQINRSIKYREWFRPFAPAITKSMQDRYFELKPNDNSYFMEKVFSVKLSMRQKIPAVVHFDGSGRLQTVSSETNHQFYKLIQHFHDFTDCPVVLNTSFNVNNMPLVETPTDAIHCFYTCGLDDLIIGNTWVRKQR